MSPYSSVYNVFDYTVQFNSMGSPFVMNLITVELNEEEAEKRLKAKLKKECISEEDIKSVSCEHRFFEQKTPDNYHRTGIIYFNSEPA